MVHKFKEKSARKRPSCIPKSAWPAWLEYWNNDEVKRKALQAKKNRMTKPDGPVTGISKYKGGSRSVVEHFAKLMKCLLMTSLSGLHAEGDGGGIDMSSLFVDVVGVSEKKRVFSLRNQSHVYSALSGESYSSTPQVNANMINNFEDLLQILENQLQESHKQF
ncbi:hypothetical protein C2S53_006952 [Perilla frutescens var. hirtella]|uniref:Uncharacterized protein n=1 Tax=Perilla frutescens var. hirtella TaxID=608512 RepID=A0AAD4J0P1_PERFH|nr:hypothetical protein C2S53_006952 [Perilla frutescens var. hirtella]